MSDFSYNIKANFKRYTKGKNKAEYIAKMALFTALSFIFYAFAKFPLPFMFPVFLEMQISEIPALFAGFSLGPVSGCLVIILKCLLKMPMSGTFQVGEATDILLGICLVLPSSLIYNAKKNKNTAFIGLVVGSLIFTFASLIVNRWISVPFYVEIMFKGNFEPILTMVRPLYKNVTQANFYKYYLLLGVLPFNLLRIFIVALITFLLYPRLEKPLRLETAVPPRQPVVSECGELSEVYDAIPLTGEVVTETEPELSDAFVKDIDADTEKEVANDGEK